MYENEIQKNQNDFFILYELKKNVYYEEKGRIVLLKKNMNI